MGEISWVVRLARYMSEECPVYAFQARGFDGRAEPFGSMEEMAAAYVAAVREVDPHGPYVLGGYSLGGTVALEMAHQLAREGLEVSHLILLDAYAPGSHAMQTIHTVDDEDFTLLAVTNLLALQWSVKEFLRAEMLPPGDRQRKIDFAAAHLFANSLQPFSLPDLTAHLRRFVQLLYRHAEFTEGYEARPLRAPLKAVLFRGTQGFSAADSALNLPRVEIPTRELERDLGWGALLASPPEVRDVDADHFSMSVEPAIQTVAQHISRILADDGAGAPPAPDEATRKKGEIFEAIREQVLRVLGDVPREAVTAESSLRALGANSIDRVEIVTCAMEALDTNVPRTRLAGVNDLRSLVDVFYEHSNGA
jgi:thioesterase domain-containing protein/acyl carrier protein